MFYLVIWDYLHSIVSIDLFQCILGVSLLCPQQQWTLTDFVVSKVTRTCDNTCTASAAPALDAATATSTTLVTCTDVPTAAPDLTGLSALQCYNCAGDHNNAACKALQNSGSSPKVGGISVAKAAACTQCYVSRLQLQFIIGIVA